MYGKIACFVALLALMFASDWSQLAQAVKRDRRTYGTLLAAIVYLGFLSVSELHWPNLNDAFDLLAKPAKQLVQWMNPTVAKQQPAEEESP